MRKTFNSKRQKQRNPTLSPSQCISHPVGFRWASKLAKLPLFWFTKVKAPWGSDRLGTELEPGASPAS